MTSTRGYIIVAAPCCGARYALTNYRSINLHAYTDWTERRHQLIARLIDDKDTALASNGN